MDALLTFPTAHLRDGRTASGDRILSQHSAQLMHTS